MLYYRRKILLALLETFGGKLTAKSLQKYLFLFTRKQDLMKSLILFRINTVAFLFKLIKILQH